MQCSTCYKELPKPGKKPNKSGLCKNCYNQQYKKLNRSEERLRNKTYYEENKEKIRANKRAYSRNKKLYDPLFKLKENLRVRLVKAINRGQKSGSAVSDLGCSIQEFKLYLESKFQPGMSWSNWTRDGWHIDHIIPLSSFDLKDPVQLKKACHYTNLQPLWASDNLAKRDSDGNTN